VTNDALVDLLTAVLQLAEVTPVLADVGCSGARHAIWNPIASQSVFVGFDPDSRDLPAELKGHYGTSILVNSAVCADDNDDSVEFVLTRYPSCSSTLEPNLEALRHYVFYPYFLPEERRRVPATSLNRVIAAHGLGSIDWLKLDSQGTDLRILRSLAGEHFDNLVAVEVEPGLIDAYFGEDLFVDVHRGLTQKGFWLSELGIQAYPRARSESLTELATLSGTLSPESIGRLLKGSPTAVEARYLRNIPHAAARGRRQLVLLFVFAMLDRKIGFAFDVMVQYEHAFGKGKVAESMRHAVKCQIENSLQSRGWAWRRMETLRSRLRYGPIRAIGRTVARWFWNPGG
jgi:hypothetical protein